PEVIQLNTQVRASYRLKPLKTNLSGIFLHDYKTGYAILSEQLLGVQNQTLNLSLSMGFELQKRIHLQAGHSYSRSIQYYDGQPTFTFQDNRTTASASYKHGLWRADISAAHNWQQVSPSSNRFWLLGFDVERRFKKPSIRLRLTGRNVLNLRGNTMILPDFGANYTGFSSFQTIGGQIMGSVAYLF
ncbi:MAG: hypothetical protein ACK4NS_00860, partial [Saprospiraceae bacterium]